MDARRGVLLRAVLERLNDGTVAHAGDHCTRVDAALVQLADSVHKLVHDSSNGVPGRVLHRVEQEHGRARGAEQVPDMHERAHDELVELLSEVALGEVRLKVQRAEDLDLEGLWSARGHGELVRHGGDEAALRLRGENRQKTTQEHTREEHAMVLALLRRAFAILTHVGGTRAVDEIHEVVVVRLWRCNIRGEICGKRRRRACRAIYGIITDA